MAFIKHVFPKFRRPVAQMAVVLPCKMGQEEAISNAKRKLTVSNIEAKQRPIFETPTTTQSGIDPFLSN